MIQGMAVGQTLSPSLGLSTMPSRTWCGDCSSCRMLKPAGEAVRQRVVPLAWVPWAGGGDRPLGPAGVAWLGAAGGEAPSCSVAPEGRWRTLWGDLASKCLPRQQGCVAPGHPERTGRATGCWCSWFATAEEECRHQISASNPDTPQSGMHSLPLTIQSVTSLPETKVA